MRCVILTMMPHMKETVMCQKARSLEEYHCNGTPLETPSWEVPLWKTFSLETNFRNITTLEPLLRRPLERSPHERLSLLRPIFAQKTLLYKHVCCTPLETILSCILVGFSRRGSLWTPISSRGCSIINMITPRGLSWFYATLSFLKHEISSSSQEK